MSTWSMEAPIISRGNGWWECTLRVTPSAIGGGVYRKFRWRTMIVECCQGEQRIADGHELPFWFTEYGEMRPLSRQCNGCGTRNSPIVYEVPR